MKILFHIDDHNKWDMVLGNIKNVIKAEKEIGETYLIEVVATGDAVISLQEDLANSLGLYSIMKEVSSPNVTLAACHNALNKFKIEKEKLSSFVKVVPAGMIEIVRKQEDGFSYIKP